MMRNKALLAGAAFAALVLGAAPALAANIALTMWNSGNIGDAVTESGVGSADLGPQNLDGVTVTLTFAGRQTSPNGLTEGNINIINTTDTVQTLNMIVGANGFVGAVSNWSLTATILAALGGADLTGSFYVDAGNTLNGLSTGVTGLNIRDFDSLSLLGPDSFSFNGVGLGPVSGTYGLAERLSLNLAPGAQIAVQGISMEAGAVPEPGTWALMGVGFGLMALFGVKRARKDRLATFA
jgi:PEP-CTERM motif